MFGLSKREIIIACGMIILLFTGLLGKTILNDINKPIIQTDSTIETNKEEKMDDDQEEVSEEIQTESQEKKVIVVDVCGAVANPGIVELMEGERIEKAIRLAGGLLESADRRQINLARIAVDEEQIYVPFMGENIDPMNNGTPGKINSGDNQTYKNSNDSDKININTASVKELDSLKGIGTVLAERIVTYRSENGYFKDIQDLKKVSGIGEKKFEDIKDDICTN
ncbi:MAG: helix-hairpin-helix domain-containing protein [Bacillota bacterium]